MKQPWLKFFPRDWLQCTKLKLCSLAARGLWIDLIALAHQSEVYGHVLVNGKPPTDQQLAALLGQPVEQIAAAKSELCSSGVFDLLGETIVSRRMVRDSQISEIRRKVGSKGGKATSSRFAQAFARPLAEPVAGIFATPQISEAREQTSDRTPLPPSGGLTGKTKRALRAVLDVEAETAGVDPWLQEFARSWLAYRAERGLPGYTPKGFRALLRQVGAMGETRATAAAEFSMARNYQGLIEPGPQAGGVNGTKPYSFETAFEANARDMAARLGRDGLLPGGGSIQPERRIGS